MAEAQLPISVSVKAAVVADDRILLVRYDDDYGPHFNLPGGKVRVGESLRAAAVRKVKEETGYDVLPTKVLLVVEYVPEVWADEFGTRQKVQFQMGCRLEPAIQTPAVPPIEDLTFRGIEWVQVSRLPEIRLLPRIGARLLHALTAGAPDPLVDRW